MANSTVSNNTTQRSITGNTAQLSLWDQNTEAERKFYTLDDFPVKCVRSFRWANGDTSEEDAQRMLAMVTGQTRWLTDVQYIGHRPVSYYATIHEAWIDQGVVWGKCTLWPEGKFVDELRAGQVVEDEGEELDL
jgi:hypothetical protein